MSDDRPTDETPEDAPIREEYTGQERLNRDLREAARTLTDQEARFLVSRYYQVQDERKRQASQMKAAGDQETPNALVSWLFRNSKLQEDDIRRALDSYSSAHRIGVWAKSITGIGPVIAAGLMAHIDIQQAPTAGHVWRFAGLDPSLRWEKGKKRPWNADLKVLCWKIGESFVKQKSRPADVYGKLYDERKAYETAKNEAGDYAAQAAEKLERFKIGKNTEAYGYYSNSRLPPGHIHARAQRWTVKLFLSHWHHQAYWYAHGVLPPAPYAFSIQGHGHYIQVPNREPEQANVVLAG